MTRRLVWAKWRDPFVPAFDAVDSEDGDDLTAMDLGSLPAPHAPGNDVHSGPAIVGPMGVVPLHEHALPGRTWNFWMAHTNFDVDGPAVDVVKRVAGVEVLDVYTRYRFRVGVGKVFAEEVVKERIERALNVGPRPGAVGRVALMKTLLEKKGGHWAILQMKDGRVEVLRDNDLRAVRREADLLADDAESVVASWD
jgi:hypothetical protein